MGIRSRVPLRVISSLIRCSPTHHNHPKTDTAVAPADADSAMETSAHSDTPSTSAASTQSAAPSSTGVGRLLRTKRHHLEHTIHKAHHRFSTGSHTASAYAGQLSTLVFGKIRSLWTAHDGNVGLNQLASGTSESFLHFVCFSLLCSFVWIVVYFGWFSEFFCS